MVTDLKTWIILTAYHKLFAPPSIGFNAVSECEKGIGVKIAQIT